MARTPELTELTRIFHQEGPDVLRKYITRALTIERGNVSATARRLDVSLPFVKWWFDRLGMRGLAKQIREAHRKEREDLFRIPPLEELIARHNREKGTGT